MYGTLRESLLECLRAGEFWAESWAIASFTVKRETSSNEGVSTKPLYYLKA
ncbi:hypothetical protein [Gloeocapsopsis sp. IPPAS B-1203]|uniref:hypothetical protein n=1 Tax=Gloeocapsopsis sp. IPPAS B-1203 TaxID=2049454 RepID=UPI00030BD468|nr:hypothetical protein [Gloeocapsopsis sp. IPPAS B-1203]